MLVEIFRSGAVDSWPSRKRGILFECRLEACNAPSPTMQIPQMDECWMTVDEWVRKGGCTFRGALV